MIEIGSGTVAHIYHEHDSDAYRHTLKDLFLDHTEWAAYDDLKEICDDQEWQSLYEGFERQFANDRQKLITMYVHEGELQKAFAEVICYLSSRRESRRSRRA